MANNKGQRSKGDRRSNATDANYNYKGPERRSNKQRRIWIDRMYEIHEKLNENSVANIRFAMQTMKGIDKSFLFFI